LVFAIIIYIQTTKTNYNESYIPKTAEKGWGWVKEEGTTQKEDMICTCKTRSHLESWLNFDFFIWTLMQVQTEAECLGCFNTHILIHKRKVEKRSQLIINKVIRVCLVKTQKIN